MRQTPDAECVDVLCMQADNYADRLKGERISSRYSPIEGLPDCRNKERDRSEHSA